MDNREAVRKASEAAKQSFDQTVQENIKSIEQRNKKYNFEKYGCPDCFNARCFVSCPRYLAHAEPEMFWHWWGKTSPPNHSEREPINNLPAPPAKKSSSKAGHRRRKKTTDRSLLNWTVD